jgi:hypothetical protein
MVLKNPASPDFRVPALWDPNDSSKIPGAGEVMRVRIV